MVAFSHARPPDSWNERGTPTFLYLPVPLTHSHKVVTLDDSFSPSAFHINVELCFYHKHQS